MKFRHTAFIIVVSSECSPSTNPPTPRCLSPCFFFAFRSGANCPVTTYFYNKIKLEDQKIKSSKHDNPSNWLKKHASTGCMCVYMWINTGRSEYARPNTLKMATFFILLSWMFGFYAARTANMWKISFDGNVTLFNFQYPFHTHAFTHTPTHI